MKNEITGTKFRLIVMNFLQFAVWGAYLTSMGTYLYNIGLGEKIGLFYAMQGIVSLFMPAVMGIIADRWVPAQKLLGWHREIIRSLCPFLLCTLSVWHFICLHWHSLILWHIQHWIK